MQTTQLIKTCQNSRQALIRVGEEACLLISLLWYMSTAAKPPFRQTLCQGHRRRFLVVPVIKIIFCVEMTNMQPLVAPIIIYISVVHFADDFHGNCYTYLFSKS